MSTATLVPESAPFSDEQRAWLNGFLTGFLGFNGQEASRSEVAQFALPPVQASESEEDLDDAPWHDPALVIDDRMKLAEGKPLPHKLMAAMAQLDCGSCGYLCKTYSSAIASGSETNLTLCSPGGKETKQILKQLLRESNPGESNSGATANGKPANGKPSNGKPSNGKASNGKPSNGKPSNGATNGAARNGAPASPTKVGSRQNPFRARLLESLPLNKSGSAKDTRHVTIDLGESGIKYDVGDALGIYPTNCNELVLQIIARLGVSADSEISSPTGTVKSLADALTEDFCLKEPTDELLEVLLEEAVDPQVCSLLQGFLSDGVPEGFDVLDALETVDKLTLDASRFVGLLSPLNPRLYSIASSMAKVGSQVHLTVGKVTFKSAGRLRKGVASTMLADRLECNQELRVFVQPNHGGFTLPTDPESPIIMVGPGTGVAPFIAFLQEREALAAHGKNWLFFGDQHQESDFLYEQQLAQWQASGLLTNLDTAFSRDSDKKVYVQDKMRQRGAELWSWLDAGAYFYVCGDASRMAADVDAALKEVVGEHGAMSREKAEQFVKQLSSERRYVRDVY